VPFRVNGDDVAAVSSDEHYAYWKESVEQASFELSVGKNFLSTKFLTVNTEMYVVNKCDDSVFDCDYPWYLLDPEWRDTTFSYVPYVNGSLVFQDHMRADNSEKIFGGQRVLPIGQRSEAFLRGFDSNFKDRLMTIFLEENKDLLDSLPSWVPWYAPEEAGGLGLLVTRRRTMSVQQKKFCYFMNTHAKEEGIMGLKDLIEKSPLSFPSKGTALKIEISRDESFVEDPSASIEGYLESHVTLENRLDKVDNKNLLSLKEKRFRRIISRLEAVFLRAQSTVNRSVVANTEYMCWTKCLQPSRYVTVHDFEPISRAARKCVGSFW
jgi:hypothetical protein